MAEITSKLRSLWMILFVMFELASASTNNVSGARELSFAQEVNFTVTNNIEAGEIDGECTIKCVSHYVSGISTTVMIDLNRGQEKTWSKFVDEVGPDSICCEFTWVSTVKHINYDVFYESSNRNFSLDILWDLTEEGLYQQVNATTNSFELVAKWK